MEVWILYGEDIESTADLAFEVRRFISEAAKMDITLKVFKPSQFDLLVTEEERDSILIDGELVPLPDFCFPYLHHGDRSYFSLSIVRQLERLGVTVFNNAAAIEMVADKLHTHQVMAENHMPTPATMLAKFPVDIELIERTIGFPVVVKTLLGSNGTGVFLIENAKAFHDLMELIGETNPNIQLIFQKFIESSKGRDLRLFVVDGEVIAAMERKARDGGFKANYSAGGSVHEYIPDQEARDMAIKTAALLNIQVAGIDLLFTDKGYTICEANTFPGFKGLESACDVNVPQKIFEAMHRHTQTKDQQTPRTVKFEDIRSTTDRSESH
ncbi:MAG: 30S ribosomal protein S6--L-glutamate ligase [Alphaproteobacteria bacterium CG_4_9_14_3_um_filter_47_13]|nr:MAG: 30S ribosomal protein S6--L-glutamate ligase [Alphaproteobacteria bacterium CG_4_9_14_3_um_filter_47_13]